MFESTVCAVCFCNFNCTTPAVSLSMKLKGDMLPTLMVTQGCNGCQTGIARSNGTLETTCCSVLQMASFFRDLCRRKWVGHVPLLVVVG